MAPTAETAAPAETAPESEPVGEFRQSVAEVDDSLRQTVGGTAGALSTALAAAGFGFAAADLPGLLIGLLAGAAAGYASFRRRH